MIKLIARKEHDRGRQIAFFTVDGYEFTDSNVPAELNTDKRALAWLKKNEDRYMFLILQRLYRDGKTWADWQRFKTDKNTELEAFQKWVKAGHRNLTGEEGGKKIYQVISKQPWRSIHPKGLVLKIQIAKAKTVADIKKILDKMIII